MIQNQNYDLDKGGVIVPAPLSLYNIFSGGVRQLSNTDATNGILWNIVITFDNLNAG